MKVDGWIKLKEREHIRLSSIDRFGPNHKSFNLAERLRVNAIGNGTNLKIIDEPLKVDLRKARARHQAVALHIVQSISIKLTRNNGGVNVAGTWAFDCVGYIIVEAATVLLQAFANLAVPYKGIAHNFMPRQLKRKAFTDFLEGVAEWAVANVVHERRRE